MAKGKWLGALLFLIAAAVITNFDVKGMTAALVVAFFIVVS